MFSKATVSLNFRHCLARIAKTRINNYASTIKAKTFSEQNFIYTKIIDN